MNHSLQQGGHQAAPTQVSWRTLLVLAVLTVPWLSGCSSKPEDKIYEALKCAKVASMLGQKADANAVTPKLEAIMQDLPPLQGSQAMFMMQLGQRFQEDMDLEGHGIERQMKILTKVYESSKCQELYR